MNNYRRYGFAETQHSQSTQEHPNEQIRKNLTEVGIILEGFEYNALVDGGSTVSFITDNVWKTITAAMSRTKKDFQVEEDNIRTPTGILPVVGTVPLRVRVGDQDFMQKFWVVVTDVYEVLLGIDFLRRYEWTIEYTPNGEILRSTTTEAQVLRTGPAQLPPQTLQYVKYDESSRKLHNSLVQGFYQVLQEHGTNDLAILPLAQAAARRTNDSMYAKIARLAALSEEEPNKHLLWGTDPWDMPSIWDDTEDESPKEGKYDTSAELVSTPDILSTDNAVTLGYGSDSTVTLGNGCSSTVTLGYGFESDITAPAVRNSAGDDSMFRKRARPSRVLPPEMRKGDAQSDCQTLFPRLSVYQASAKTHGQHQALTLADLSNSSKVLQARNESTARRTPGGQKGEEEGTTESKSERKEAEFLENDDLGHEPGDTRERTADELRRTEWKVVIKKLQKNVYLKADEKKKMAALIEEHSRLFSDGRKALGRTRHVEYDVKMVNEATTELHVKYRTLGVVLDHILDEMMDEYFQAGLYYQGSSPFCSPCFLVIKKRRKMDQLDIKDMRRTLRKLQPDNEVVVQRLAEAIKKLYKFRMVADYRQVNTLVETKQYPLPNIKEWYGKIMGRPYLSTIDFAAGFHQIVMTPEASKVYAVVTSKGLFLPRRLPFGPKNGPAVMQHLLNDLIAPIPEAFGLIDDILIASHTFDQHLESLRMLFGRIGQFGMTINAKAQLGRGGLEFLGVIATHLGIAPKPSNIVKLRRYPRPKDKKETKSFIAFVRWLEDFIPCLAARIRPISKLLQTKEQFRWTDEQEEAYQNIIQSLRDNTRLHYPDLRFPFYLYTDWCPKGIAGMLVQYIWQRMDVIVQGSAQGI